MKSDDSGFQVYRFDGLLILALMEDGLVTGGLWFLMVFGILKGVGVRL